MINDGVPEMTLTATFSVGGSPYEGKVPLKLFTIRPDAPLRWARWIEFLAAGNESHACQRSGKCNCFQWWPGTG